MVMITVLVSSLLYAMQQCMAPCKRIAIAVNTFQFYLQCTVAMCVCVPVHVWISVFFSCVGLYRSFSFRFMKPFLKFTSCAVYAYPPDICMTIWLCSYLSWMEKKSLERWKNSHPNRANIFKCKTTRRVYGMSVGIWPRAPQSSSFPVFFLCFIKCVSLICGVIGTL